MGMNLLARVVLSGLVAAAPALPAEPATAADGGGNVDADRYCELAVNTVADDGTPTTRIYPTYGINDCPSSWWEAIDPDQVAQVLNAQSVIPNGPRYWVMDDILSYQGPADLIMVNGYNLGLVATVVLAADSAGTSSVPYADSTVHRYTKYSYYAGTTIYQLTDPDGRVYVMQSYSLQKNPSLDKAAYSAPGVITPPEGWTYAAVPTPSDLYLCANGNATVIQDEWAASYQLVTDGPCVLSAYFGAAILPAGIDRTWCPGATAAGGLGGMPLVLDQQIVAGDAGWYGGVEWALDPADFQVQVGPHGEWVTPACATLQPAVDASEQQTILLAGSFGTGGDNMPTGIQVVGDVSTAGGQSINDLKVVSVFPLDAGSNLVFARVFDPAGVAIATSGAGSTAYCPSERTSKVVKLTFSGGVRGANGTALTDDAGAMAAISVMATDAAGARKVLQPFALRDDDDDNYLDVCLGADAAGLTPRSVSVNGNTFFSPMNAPNQAAAVRVAVP